MSSSGGGLADAEAERLKEALRAQLGRVVGPGPGERARSGSVAGDDSDGTRTPGPGAPWSGQVEGGGSTPRHDGDSHDCLLCRGNEVVHEVGPDLVEGLGHALTLGGRALLDLAGSLRAHAPSSPHAGHGPGGAPDPDPDPDHRPDLEEDAP